MNPKILPVTMLGTALLLGACGQAPVTTQQSIPNTSGMTSVTVSAPIGKAGLSTQGLARYGEGAIANVVKVKVYRNGSETPAHFNDSNTLDENGEHAYLVLTPETPSLNMLVPQGEYTLESIGLFDHDLEDTDVEGSFVAYGTQAETLTGNAPKVKQLKLHTLADADNSSFQPEQDMEFAPVNATFGTLLKVRSPSIDEDNGVPVPLSDYSVEYSFENAEGGPNSKLGSSVGTNNPEDTSAVLNGKATVNAWVATGEEVAEQKTFELTFSLPYYFSIGGTVTGVEDGGTVTLQNGADSKTVSNGTFNFMVKGGSEYEVVQNGSEPEGYSCIIDDGNGIALGNVTNIIVDCPPLPPIDPPVGP